MENCKFRITTSDTIVTPQTLKELGPLGSLMVFPRCKLLVNEGEIMPFCSNSLHNYFEENCPVSLCFSKAEISVEEMNKKLREIFSGGEG